MVLEEDTVECSRCETATLESEVIELFSKMIDTRADSFEAQLSKFEITE